MIVVVLHEPQELVNVAHVVRAMKNFAVATELRLVAPREFDLWRIEGIAHRSADVLAHTAPFETLDAALADCVHVAGFTARERTARHTVRRPRDAAPALLEAAEQGPVALLYGREDKGLPNDALDRCHSLVTIPADPSYPSLNLAHAVVVMLYELALARGDGARALKPPRRAAPPATAEELERFFADADRALQAVGFFRSHVVVPVLRTLRDLTHRAAPDQREAKLLRAIAIEVAKTRARGGAARPEAEGRDPDLPR
jgi:tRNA/rRNA methyltransferase/tRNA (cytidine32/uridine32-2'-O)-methyltransferase